VAQGVEMLTKGGNVRAMSAIVGAMSEEDLERGMELARIAGELETIGDVVDMLQMPVLSEVLTKRGLRLRQIAVDTLLSFTATRALSGAMGQTGKDIEALGENEVAEGVVRLAVSDAAAARSQELAQMSDALVSQGVDELVTAKLAGEVAREAATAGVAKIASGAEAIGAGETTAQMGEALTERADQ
jgi:hypothetical protein